MYWSDDSRLIELRITKKQAISCSHTGECYPDVERLSKVPEIKRQLDEIGQDTLSRVLKEYGAWSDQERENHAENLIRVLWLACCDIAERSTLD